MGPAHLGESTRIATDLPCLKCGYNLRTLPLAGRCPECGVPVERTMRGDLLRFSDPKWVAGLSGGVQCWLAALLVFLLGISLAAITIGLGARGKAGRFIAAPTMTCYFGSVLAPLIIERLAAARLPLAPQGYLGNLIIEWVTRILGFAVVAGEFACVPFGAVLILRYRQAFEGAAKDARFTWAASAVS